MPDVRRSKHRSAAALALVVLLALLLAACGGASSNATRSVAATASASASTALPAGPSGSKSGASNRSSTRRSSSRGASTSPPAGASRGALARVARGARGSSLRECPAKSAITLARRRRAGGLGRCDGRVARRLKRGPLSPTAKHALDVFAACMRDHGVNLPNPDTSGRRPVFNTSQLNVAGSKFKAAEAKCVPALRPAFGPRRGTGGG